ncbi:MAG: lipid A deacylase LpxR family protein [Bacteroidetes bacterium]|nr:lipid A deacylase LpxR family protein [Bacteroidota bacterium]
MKIFFIGCALFACARIFGQQDSLNRELVKNNRYYSFIYENDFFSATDRYYTQGVISELILPVIKKSPFSKTLIRLNKNVQNYYGLHFEQDCFTPISIRFDTLNRLERPFTGTFAVGHFLSSIDPVKKQRLNTQLDIGIIGPCAKCEEEQKGIHKGLDNIAPLGWENQLSQDIVLNYSASYEKAIFSKEFIELIGSADVRGGTLYDDLGGSLHLRFGKMNSYFKQLGIIKNAQVNKFQLFFTVKAKEKWVGYNATLQGGPFSSSIHEITAKNVSRAVFSSYFSVVLAYKRISLEYARTYITKEFVTGVDHGWGRCNITVCF